MRIKDKNIYINRGDAMTLDVVNNTDYFRVGDYLTFYICQEGNYENVVFSKTFNVTEKTDTVTIKLTSAEMKLGEPLKNGERTYWYEIELNGNTTLVGADLKGNKCLILYPEAIREGE